MQFSRAQLLFTSEIGVKAEPVDSLGGTDSLGVSPQWQQPRSITHLLTMLSRLDNPPRKAAIRHRSFLPCHMCQRRR
jgi:hypothetical protein